MPKPLGPEENDMVNGFSQHEMEKDTTGCSTESAMQLRTKLKVISKQLRQLNIYIYKYIYKNAVLVAMFSPEIKYTVNNVELRRQKTEVEEH